jgi:hypothetical protein
MPCRRKPKKAEVSRANKRKECLYFVAPQRLATFSGGCTTGDYIRGTEMSRQSVFRSQFSRGVLRSEFAEQDLGESFTKKISQSARSVN